MATFTWKYYGGSGPSWEDIDSNLIIFSGDNEDLAIPLDIGDWNSGTHIGTITTVLTDDCGANHCNNVKFITSTQFNKGSGTLVLNDTNLLEDDCTLQIVFTDASAVVTSEARFFAFDGINVEDEADGIEAYAFEQGVGGTSWKLINDNSTNFGGDNPGKVLELQDQSVSTTHQFFIALSARGESIGEKPEIGFGITLTYS